MKIAIHTLGTRGDIQPYLALALGLKAAGHTVLIAAPTQYEAFIGGRGIPFSHLPGEFLDLMDTPEAKAAMAGGGGFAAGFKMIKQFKPIGRKQLKAEWQAAQQFQPDLIIYHPKAIAALHIAERLSCPAVLASPLPGFTPTRQFASPMVPFRSVGPFNPLTHTVMAEGAEAIFRKMIAEWRSSELNLPKKPANKLKPRATLYAYSPSVLPSPSDWPDDVVVTGYWFLEEERRWQPDPALQAFLDAGEPPVYVGFGSMPGLDPAELTELVRQALSDAGKRGVLATGGGAIQAGPAAPDLHIIEGAPHDQLFPLMSACVHHGGAGTTGASLRAGKPTIICPFFGDQPFWARIVRDLGAGPAPIDKKHLTSALLAAAIIEATTNAGMARRAAEIGARIRQEHGVNNAIAHLERQGLLTPRSAPAAQTEPAAGRG
ncbi:MAG TPA: glycosyltransferase [Devosia sp.]|jgi:UDP:flavonoid glycosyltransferase YjiC (YdhE family)|uniref:glycosyltransferase n=1 Tax=Devosia sp. TaxID=1871048 RepID=UPI002DDD21CE|nr:glycosyltransferase [Devosia sp.]HEV2516116.1 glycosyltransferase [Devosia sp.]